MVKEQTIQYILCLLNIILEKELCPFLLWEISFICENFSFW